MIYLFLDILYVFFIKLTFFFFICPPNKMSEMDVSAFLRLSPSERNLLRPSVREAMQIVLDEQTDEWRESMDPSSFHQKRKCDFCYQPRRLHPYDGSELCDTCDPIPHVTPPVECFICRKSKYARYLVGEHPICKDCGWPNHRPHDCKCFTCRTPNLPISWYKGLLDYYAMNENKN